MAWGAYSHSSSVIFPYVIEPAKRLATVTVSGSVRGSDLIDTANALYHDAAWVAHADALWHCLAITELLLERNDLPRFRELQREVAMASGDGCDVILVGRPLDKMMARAYVSIARGIRRRTYVCGSEAEAHLLLASRK